MIYFFFLIYDIFKESKEKINMVKIFSVLRIHFALCLVILFLVQGFRAKVNPNHHFITL